MQQAVNNICEGLLLLGTVPWRMRDFFCPGVSEQNLKR